MLTLNRLGDAHRPRLVHHENDRDVFLTHDLLILNLSSCFKDIVDCLVLWFLLFIDTDIVNIVAEFTFPNLFFTVISLLAYDPSFWFHFFNHTVDIEHSVALEASYRVTSCNLCVVLEGFELDLEDIGVYLLPKPSS